LIKSISKLSPTITPLVNPTEKKGTVRDRRNTDNEMVLRKTTQNMKSENRLWYVRVEVANSGPWRENGGDPTKAEKILPRVQNIRGLTIKASSLSNRQ